MRGAQKLSTHLPNLHLFVNQERPWADRTAQACTRACALLVSVLRSLISLPKLAPGSAAPLSPPENKHAARVRLLQHQEGCCTCLQSCRCHQSPPSTPGRPSGAQRHVNMSIKSTAACAHVKAQGQIQAHTCVHMISAIHITPGMKIKIHMHISLQTSPAHVLQVCTRASHALLTLRTTCRTCVDIVRDCMARSCLS